LRVNHASLSFIDLSGVMTFPLKKKKTPAAAAAARVMGASH
jgi:hypothetical protein